MKFKYLSYILPLAAISMNLASCSNISEDDRYIYVEPANVAKRVLIEDFTGQNCKNCPNAALTIEQLQEDYGADNVIAVGIYSGPFGKTPLGVPYSLTTDTGDNYFDYWGVQDQPSAMIDRHGVVSTYHTWSTLVRDAIQQEASLILDASCTYDNDSRTASIQVNASGVNDIDGKIQVWLIEDSITDVQRMPDGKPNQQYVHNHVFRTTVNGLWGNDFSITTGEEKELAYQTTISEDWKAEDMSAVIFVYNTSGVLQTVKAKIIPTNEGTENNNTDKK